MRSNFVFWSSFSNMLLPFRAAVQNCRHVVRDDLKLAVFLSCPLELEGSHRLDLKHSELGIPVHKEMNASRKFIGGD
jgi:hypothetical protein